MNPSPVTAGGPAVVTTRVAMLGGRSVGKTSVLTSLKVAADDFFAHTSVEVRPDDDTDQEFTQSLSAMMGELASRRSRFTSEDVKGIVGNSDVRTYRLGVFPTLRGKLPFDNESRIEIIAKDYPGGWISDPGQSGSAESARKVADILEESNTLVLAVDAVAIMEFGDDRDLDSRLGITATANHVRAWAKRRKHHGDRHRLIIAPVKCEAYFNDNGGRNDSADRLARTVTQRYAEVLKAYRSEVGNDARILYAPVDTIGAIDFVRPVTIDDGTGGTKRVAEYAVRYNADGTRRGRSVVGAEPILAVLVADALSEAQTLHEAQKKVAEVALATAKAAERRAQTDLNRAKRELEETEAWIAARKRTLAHKLFGFITNQDAKLEKIRRTTLDSHDIAELRRAAKAEESAAARSAVLAKNDQLQRLAKAASAVELRYGRVRQW